MRAAQSSSIPYRHTAVEPRLLFEHPRRTWRRRHLTAWLVSACAGPSSLIELQVQDLLMQEKNDSPNGGGQAEWACRDQPVINPPQDPAISSSIRLRQPSFWTFQPVFGHSVHASRVGEPGEAPDSPEGCTPDSSGSAGTALEATQPNRSE